MGQTYLCGHGIRPPAAFHTGCKLNFSETSTLARQLGDAGYARVHADDAPDVVVINTCSVTDGADAKCRNAVRRAVQATLKLLWWWWDVTPSSSQKLPKSKASTSSWAPAKNLAAHLEAQRKAKKPRHCRRDRVRAPCRAFPAATPARFESTGRLQLLLCILHHSAGRGRSRSANVAQTVAGQKAVAAGAKEIVLTGVNIGDFGTAMAKLPRLGART